MTKQQNAHVEMHFKPEAITNGVLNKKKQSTSGGDSREEGRL